MKSLSTIFLLLFALLFQACQKENIAPKENKEYKEGLLIVEKEPEAALGVFFGLINSFNFPVNRMSGQYYVSQLPPDSLPYVNQTLATKSYLNKAGWSGGPAYMAKGKIHLFPWFYKMDKESQQDWLSTIELLQLNEDTTHQQYFFIEVPKGMEEHWRDELRKEEIVASANLVYYVDFIDAPEGE